jgi:hypothetical protein
MRKPQGYSYTTFDPALGEAGFRPLLPITLDYQDRSIQANGLLDTGATINVLPYQLGLEVGAIWEEQTTSLQLTGNLAQFDARVIVLNAKVSDFETARLVFAWTKAPNVPLIFGQVNFIYGI